MGAAIGFVSIFHAHTRWRYARLHAVTGDTHKSSGRRDDHPPGIRNLEHLVYYTLFSSKQLSSRAALVEKLGVRWSRDNTGTVGYVPLWYLVNNFTIHFLG